MISNGAAWEVSQHTAVRVNDPGELLISRSCSELLVKSMRFEEHPVAYLRAIFLSLGNTPCPHLMTQKAFIFTSLTPVAKR